jgi:hypothetical protein
MRRGVVLPDVPLRRAAVPWNMSDAWSDDVVLAMMECLRASKTLAYLNIRGVNFSEGGIRALADALACNDVIEKLKVDKSAEHVLLPYVTLPICGVGLPCFFGFLMRGAGEAVDFLVYVSEGILLIWTGGLPRLGLWSNGSRVL